MKEITIQTPVTCANVGPGYDIFAVSLKENSDLIKLKLNETRNISIKIKNNTQNIPTAIEDNTAGLAVRELFRSRNILQGVEIEIMKRKISGAGLGTTGASASAVIFGLNKLLDLDLSNEEMIDYARCGEVASGGSPHADNVAAALLGGFVLIGNYQPIEVMRLKIPEFPIVLAVMTKSQRTTRGFITYEIGVEKLRLQMAHCAGVIHAIHRQDEKLFGKAINTDFIAEPVRGAAISEYWEAKKKVLKAGAFGFNVSGGGSSVFAVCSEQNRDEIAELMKEIFKNNPHFVDVIKTTTSNTGVREII